MMLRRAAVRCSSRQSALKRCIPSFQSIPAHPKLHASQPSCQIPKLVTPSHVFQSPVSYFSTSVSETAGTNDVAWPEGAGTKMHKILRSLPRSTEMRNLIVEAGLNPAEWSIFAAGFRRAFVKTPQEFFEDQSEIDDFADQVLNPSSQPRQSKHFIFYPHLLHFARQNDYLQNSVSDEQMYTLQELTDLRLPHELYPLATAMKRKVIYHEGPTNSGKTYEALQQLKTASHSEDGGIYCGPLRLLALEIYERLNTGGTYTSLVTGQEKRIIPAATHISCTVEMANINRPWDVAVLDEIQLLGDPQRGWAWTRAFFGLQAKELHVCGSKEAVPLIKKFCETTGDDFELRSYERRSPLSVAPKALQSYKHVKPGDCVVAFSRREIFQIKREIEIKTGLKCCIIYGQLPPETRSQQARLFNAEDNEYNVLVASDAVGMGLNLNIKRVVFSTVKKFSGQGGMADIPAPLAKQIAGRAGRSGGRYAADGGTATTLHPTDLSFIKESVEEEPTSLPAAGLFPSSEQMEEFAKQLPGVTDLGQLLDKYMQLARLDGDYFMCNHLDMKDAAAMLSDIELDLSDRFTFCMAPVNMRNPLARKIFLEYARAHAKDESVKLDIFLPRFAPHTPDALRDVEVKAQIIDLYLWLSIRFPDTFVENELAIQMKERVLALVEQGLLNTTYYKGRKKRVVAQKPRRQEKPSEKKEQKEDKSIFQRMWNQLSQ